MSTERDSRPLAFQAPLCLVDDIADGGALAISTHVDEQRNLMLLRQGARVFVYHNECSHAGRSLDYAPGKFLLDHGRIVCPVHGATYVIETGACCGGPAKNGLKGVAVEVIDGLYGWWRRARRLGPTVPGT